MRRVRPPISAGRMEDILPCSECGEIASTKFHLKRPSEDNLEGFSDICLNSHESPSKFGSESEEADATDSGYSEEEDWKEIMCKIDAAII